MTMPVTQCLIKLHEAHHNLEDYQGGVPRWCSGCGDNAILAAVQRLCRDEDLAPERTVFVSGIGCSSRFPHYMKTYGFHGIHGRAFPIAEGVKMARPDLAVFVNTGDGDCCSIGAAHWIHAIRYNMNLTAILHDNHVYGLTKKQASPTSPRGLKSNTTPRGSTLEALNPLTVTLGVTNVSFVAQAVDWIPELLYDILRQAYLHRGFSFVRIIQRCPEFLPKMFEPWLHDPGKTLLVSHPNGLTISPELSRTYRNQIEHDPLNLDRAREIASSEDPIPVGILYHNPAVPCYDDLRGVGHAAHRRADPRRPRSRARQGHRLAGGRRAGPRGRLTRRASFDVPTARSDRYGHGRPISRATPVLLDREAAGRGRRRDRRPRAASRALRALPRSRAAALRLSAGAGRPRPGRGHAALALVGRRRGAAGDRAARARRRAAAQARAAARARSAAAARRGRARQRCPSSGPRPRRGSPRRTIRRPKPC